MPPCGIVARNDWCVFLARVSRGSCAQVNGGVLPMQVGIAVRRVLAMRRMMCGCLLMLLTLGGSCQASASAL